MKNRPDAGGSTFCKSIESSGRKPIDESSRFQISSSKSLGCEHYRFVRLKRIRLGLWVQRFSIAGSKRGYKSRHPIK